MKNINGWFLPESDSYFSKILSESGSFEPGRLDLALQFVKNFRVALDIGGHVGLRSRELAPRFVSVITFEPALANYQCLVENTSFMGNIMLHNVALGDRATEVAMMESTTRQGNSGSMFVTRGTGTDMRTLDSFSISGVDFCKIDVEGLEALVLKGGETTIRRDRPVILLEQKNFRDREGRMDVDYKEAATILESWGAKCVERINNDLVYTWDNGG